MFWIGLSFYVRIVVRMRLVILRGIRIDCGKEKISPFAILFERIGVGF